MGSGIAQTFAVAGLQAVCVDVDQAALDRARTRIVEGRYGLARAHARGHLDQPIDDVMARISFGTDVEAAVSGSDLILEAVPEDFGLKVELFRRLGVIAPAGCLLVSNTSGFSITALAAATDRPATVLGWHWASPPAIMRFAEVVVHAGSDGDAVSRITALARQCGKRPVVVKDQPRAWGFVANRVYAAMVAEAQRVVAEGVVTADELDQLMVDCFNWPIGPLGMGRSAREGWTS
jgi:3-hydroxybutyryl-CoA dehydrogenase/3-hydroxyacyl-CoA dehydrogenase